MSRAHPGTRPEPRSLVDGEIEQWRLSDAILFSVSSSALLWSLIVVGVHASLT